MVAQVNKTSKNTTNEIEKMTTVPLYDDDEDDVYSPSTPISQYLCT